MTTRSDVADLNLQCVACGDVFVFSAGEQELYRLRGIAQQPEHCPACTRGRVRVANQRSA